MLMSHADAWLADSKLQSLGLNLLTTFSTDLMKED